MPNLAVEEKRKLAKSYLEMAQAIDNCRADHWGDPNFNDTDRLLQIKASTLRNYANGFMIESIFLEIKDLQKALNGLEQGTKRLNEALKHLDDTRKLLTVIASVITLGAAISTGNVAGIFGALDSIENIDAD